MVLVVLLFVGYIRVRLLEMPLERDEGEYAYAGQLILQGIPPYELAYNMKLPGTYFAYTLGMKLFGQTTAGIHMTLLAVNSLTIVFVFPRAKTLWCDHRTGCVCKLWIDVREHGGFGNGGACDAVCGVVRRSGDAAFMEGR